jgi:hypothetical protein
MYVATRDANLNTIDKNIHMMMYVVSGGVTADFFDSIWDYGASSRGGASEVIGLNTIFVDGVQYLNAGWFSYVDTYAPIEGSTEYNINEVNSINVTDVYPAIDDPDWKMWLLTHTVCAASAHCGHSGTTMQTICAVNPDDLAAVVPFAAGIAEVWHDYKLPGRPEADLTYESSTADRFDATIHLQTEFDSTRYGSRRIYGAFSMGQALTSRELVDYFYQDVDTFVKGKGAHS